MTDPIPEHAGGAEWLARRGLDVRIGVLENDCAELNRAFTTWARHHRPLFVLKAALTLDGRMTTRTGKSRWITGDRARADVHRLRDRHDAICSGVGTVLADDPRLTVRDLEGGRDPMRVIVDSRLRTPATSRVLPANSDSTVRTLIATTSAAPAGPAAALKAAGAEIWRLPAVDGRVDLWALASRLADERVLSVLSEAGPALSTSLLEVGLADEIVLYLAPTIVGGPGSAWIAGEGVDDLARAWQFELHGDPQRLGRDVKLTFRPRR
jgi:diaminohydroxyphosphoribosylaminopyrimidine deaminase/5-amino-6-(5-phosphoribosylamino)uracil reductase